ncbi:MAG: ribonuclease III [Butyrivibrio sp.]|nr:ribonuclease III [Butyrivibrio sp.]
MNLPEKIRNLFDIKELDIRGYSPLSLAFMGDSVYEIIIRTYVISQANRPANQLNRMKVKYVNAAAQAAIIDVIMDRLTPEEEDIYKRGRNAKSYTSAKNASINDYRKATGFEALCGYLYLKGQMDRLLELVKYAIEECDEKQ